MRDGVLTFSATTPGGQVFISEQKKPDDFDFNQFYNILKETRSVQTSLGTAHLGREEANRVASLVTTDTWIFMSTPRSNNYALFTPLLTHLERTN